MEAPSLGTPARLRLCSLAEAVRHLLRSGCQMTFDHKIPRSTGGLDEFDHFQIVHYACSQRKANTAFIERVRCHAP